MRQYGSHLGIAFQLVDDALDYSSETDTIGKNIGDDLSEGKVTLPLIHVMQTGSEAERALVIEAIESEEHLPYLTEIQQAIEDTKAIEYTINAASHYARRAITVLVDHIPDSPYRDALAELAEFTVSRNI
jgi:octaprenyl-diphosphate synthase